MNNLKIFKYFILFVFLLVSLPTALALGQDNRSPKAKAAEHLDKVWRSSGVPSVSVTVAYHGDLVFAQSLGYADLDNLVPATPSTVYNIGSVSKIITAVAVMQLIEEGVIDLDDSVRKYVPEFPEKGAPVTLRQIMTHTSGIRHYRSGEQLTPFGPYETFEEALDIFKDDSLLYEPGTYYNYSSFGVNLLQGVIEKVSGLSFEEYMSRHVWEPVGMLRTGLDISTRVIPGRARGYEIVEGGYENHPYEDASYKFPSGGMLSTVEDLTRFGIGLNHGYLLRQKTVDDMLQPQFESLVRFSKSGNHRPIDRWRQALLWRERKDDAGRSFYYHCGTVKGFNACLVNYVDEDLVVAIANNAEAIGFVPALKIADYFRPHQDAE